MKFSILASGSSGNCTIVESKKGSLIIDCGTTQKYLNACFEKLNYDIRKSDALLITHTHRDHISSIKMFSHLKTYALIDIDAHENEILNPYDTFNVKDFKITVIPLSHDCEGTAGYIIEADAQKLVYVTDTGYVKDELLAYLKDADYYIFESNHDLEMLMSTNRPIFLKQRIIADCGHLCNETSASILTSLIGDHTREIVLAHISQEGNTCECALNTLNTYFELSKKNTDKIKRHAAKAFEIYESGEY